MVDDPNVPEYLKPDSDIAETLPTTHEMLVRMLSILEEHLPNALQTDRKLIGERLDLILQFVQGGNLPAQLPMSTDELNVAQRNIWEDHEERINALFQRISTTETNVNDHGLTIGRVDANDEALRNLHDAQERQINALLVRIGELEGLVTTTKDYTREALRQISDLQARVKKCEQVEVAHGCRHVDSLEHKVNCG